MSPSSRVSGLLLPVSALPSRWGIGSLGAEADRFAEFLSRCGQSCWQILPLTVPDFVHSPYASPSAFAGDPMLIDIPSLVRDGLLKAEEAAAPLQSPPQKIDFDLAAWEKGARLRRAYEAFVFGGGTESAEYRAFCRRERYWLPDFSLFSALKVHFGGRPFWQWEDESARCHRPAALRRYGEMLFREVEFCRFTQYIFARQMADLRRRLGERGIRLIGDIPFYVAHDSADVWAHPELFCLREDFSPRLAAGVGPDFFSPTGQLWGNPVYDWERMRQEDCDFWIRRLMRCASMYDVIRLDHFRALDSYYTVRGGASDASKGRWRRGPGMEFFETVRKKLPHLNLLAEDLGSLTPSVHELRRRAQIPGMRVMQFAFTGEAENSFLPHNYERDCTAYLGTHDNDTTAGWWAKLEPQTRSLAAAYLDIPAEAEAETAVRRMMRMVSASAADTVIFTVQDLCAAGSEARINTPSKIGGCWEYAAPEGFCPKDAERFLTQITALYGRTGE